MSEGRPVPLPIRNVRIERWVQETAAAQSDDRSSRIVSPWPQDAPRTIVREGEYIATPSQHAAQDPAIGSSDTRVDAFRDPLVEPGLSNRRRSPGCPDAPLLDTLTTPDTISPVDSALWAELTRQGLGSLIRPTDDEEIDETEAPGIETAEQNQTAISDVAPSEVSEHSTVVPPSPLFPLRTVSERVAQVSAQDSKLDSQRRRVAYSPSAYSRQTHQSKNWDDGISVNHPYEDVMVRRRSEPLNIAVLSQVEERMRERHFARQQFMVSSAFPRSIRNVVLNSFFKCTAPANVPSKAFRR